MVFSKSINVITLRPICSVMETLVGFFSQKCLPLGSVTHQQRPADLVLTCMPLTGLCGAEVIEEWLQSLAQPLCAGLTLPLLASGRCLHCLRPSLQPPLHLGPGGDNL